MNDHQLLRYSRHILLDELGIDGQNQLLASHVLMVGAGGLGCAAALYLASAGVGRITVVDNDHVDLTNLQRQVAHTLSRVGQPKTESLAQTLAELNPDVQVQCINQRLDDALLSHWLPSVDVVLDCTDNFSTRQLINRACVQYGKPLVSGAAIRFDGQVAVYDPRQPSSPCYACVFAPDMAPPATDCATMGVFAPIVGMIGTTQAAEALKLLTGMGQSLTGRLLMLDALAMQWTEMTLPRDPVCTVCGDHHEHAHQPSA